MNRTGRLHRLGEGIGTGLMRWRSLLAVGFLVAAFVGLASDLLIQRYLAFQTSAWDLGNYNQAFYDTLYGHGFFYYTADLPSGNGGQLFTAHFSPILLALLPFYSVAPGPPTLLVLETLAMGLAALPFYVFARGELRSARWATALAAAFLASPVLLGILWYDFHPEAFLPVAVLSALVCYQKRWWKLFLVAWFITLGVIETAAPLLLAFGVLAVAGDYFVRGRPYLDAVKRVPRAVWIALGGALAWLLLALLVVPSVFGSVGSSGAYSGAYAVNFQILGANSILSVLPTAFLHPANAWSALTFDGSRKGVYVLLFLTAFGFLPVFGRLRYFLPGLIWPILALLSNAGGYYAFGDQYAAYTFPFWAAATVSGVARLRAWSVGGTQVATPSEPSKTSTQPAPRRWPRRRFVLPSRFPRQAVPAIVASAVLVGLGLGTYLISPLNSNPTDNLGIPHGFPSVTDHDQLIHRIIAMIPPGASVLTTHFLFPELSSRPNAWVLPVSSYFEGDLTFVGVLDRYVNESQFLLYDTVTDPYSTSLMQRFVNLSGFGVRAEADGVVLYERGWTQPPELWWPETLNLSGGSLAIPPAVASGPNGSYSNVLHYPGGFPNGTQLWTGPYAQLTPGTYRVNLIYRLGGTPPGSALKIEVGCHRILVSITPIDVTPAGHNYAVAVVDSPLSSVLAEANLTAPSGPLPTNLTFTVQWPSPALLDLSGWVLTPAVSVDLYAVTVVQVSTT